MVVYVSILRGINVAGHNKVMMIELKELYESMNLRKVKTYIQSGNVIFQSFNTNSSELEDMIKDKIDNALGFDVQVFIRTLGELYKIITDNPFKKYHPGNLYVTFLSGLPVLKPFNELDIVKEESEEYFFSGKEIYLYLPNGYGRTRLNNNYFEKILNLNTTTRNWRTLNKLYDTGNNI